MAVKYKYLVSSESKTRTSVLVFDRERLIRVLELALQCVQIFDSKDRECIVPSVRNFIHRLKTQTHCLLRVQTTQKELFDVWFFVMLVFFSTEFCDSEDVSWAFNNFCHYMLTDGTSHRVLVKEVIR